MPDVAALLISKNAVKCDAALKPGARGARKILVTEIIASTERPSAAVEWLSPLPDEKCPVLMMTDTEVAVFNQYAVQDRHYHKKGTELYMVMEGTMVIDVENVSYTLEQGDMLVVNPYAVHKVKAEKSRFLSRVVTIRCGGAADKYLA